MFSFICLPRSEFYNVPEIRQLESDALADTDSAMAFLFKINQQLISYAVFMRINDEIYLHHLETKKSYQNRGFATSLMIWSLMTGLAQFHSSIRGIIVLDHPMRHFFLVLGFKNVTHEQKSKMQLLLTSEVIKDLRLTAMTHVLSQKHRDLVSYCFPLTPIKIYKGKLSAEDLTYVIIDKSTALHGILTERNMITNNGFTGIHHANNLIIPVSAEGILTAPIYSDHRNRALAMCLAFPEQPQLEAAIYAAYQLLRERTSTQIEKTS